MCAGYGIWIQLNLTARFRRVTRQRCWKETAVISVGAHNTFGHPRMDVLRRLADANVSTYRTDLSGAVTFYLDGRSVSPQVASLH
jgi:beta-lactamase superfamily II metal-dependent hydrolase